MMDRFWDNVDTDGPWVVGMSCACWMWTAYRNVNGYGRSGAMLAHRMAFVLSRGRLPALHVLHACDNPSCCNPAHLFEGTDADNSADKMAKGRYRRRTLRGAECCWAKLTQADASRIRELRGAVTQTEVARRYGINQSMVSQIQLGKVWRI